MDTTWLADMAGFLLLVTNGDTETDGVPFAHENKWTSDRVGDLRTEDTR